MSTDKKDIVWRAYLIYFGFAVIMSVVIGKTVMIQFEGGKPYFLSANGGEEKIPTRIVKKEPRRGQILDDKYAPLVSSVSLYNIHMDPSVIDSALFYSEIRALCDSLQKMFPEKTASEYERMIRQARINNVKYLPIKKKATNEERRRLRTFPIYNKGRLKGGLIDNEEIILRKRPHGELLKRTLGYVQDNGNTPLLVGLEGAYDAYLRGEPGEEIEQRISTGWKKLGPIIKEPVEGANIVTTIDLEIQEVAHNELLNQLIKQNAASGCVIVMEVKTGYIKAISNLKQHENGTYYESYNKAIGEKEVPGSTFKLASLMAALEDGKVTIHDKVDAFGTYRFYGSKLEDSHEGGYGTITIQQAFEKSSNVFSKIIHNAYRDNPQAFIDRIKSFGLGDSLGIPIKGEPRPTLYEPGMPQWSGLSLPWMAIGYEVQQTPLQTLAFYNAVANNGCYVKPQFVKEVIRKNQIIKRFEPEIVIPKICSDETLRDLKICLEGVVKQGTGSALKSAYFDIAGKTGTARILNNENTMASAKKYQASFVGYFPADDPLYSCIVVVAAPTQNIYGSVVSGSVFNAIANKVYASSLQFHKPINSGEALKENLPGSLSGNKQDLTACYKAFKIQHKVASPGDWFDTEVEKSAVRLNPRKMSLNSVPNVIGMSAKDAVYLIERTGMVAKVKGYGKVRSQSLQPGEAVFKGGLITLNLAP